MPSLRAERRVTILMGIAATMCTRRAGLGLNGTRPDDKLPYGGAWLDVGTGEPGSTIDAVPHPCF